MDKCAGGIVAVAQEKVPLGRQGGSPELLRGIFEYFS